MLVRRTLPHRDLPTVGAWCFADDYGPSDVSGSAGMHVPPHPHTGLQTVTWLLEGEVHHQDSLGSEQRVRPGQLSLMTAGRGIAHAETSPADHPPTLRGVQLWVALPDAERHVAPHFEHHPRLPVLVDGGLSARLIIGELAGERSPATAYTRCSARTCRWPRTPQGRCPWNLSSSTPPSRCPTAPWSTASRSSAR